MKNQSFERNGVTVEKEQGKWQFKTSALCLIVSGKTSLGKAKQIATAIGASAKRTKASGSADILDPMARGQIRHIIAMPTYKGINFSQAAQ